MKGQNNCRTKELFVHPLKTYQCNVYSMHGEMLDFKYFIFHYMNLQLKLIFIFIKYKNQKWNEVTSLVQIVKHTFHCYDQYYPLYVFVYFLSLSTSPYIYMYIFLNLSYVLYSKIFVMYMKQEIKRKSHSLEIISNYFLECRF